MDRVVERELIAPLNKQEAALIRVYEKRWLKSFEMVILNRYSFEERVERKCTGSKQHRRPKVIDNSNIERET